MKELDNIKGLFKKIPEIKLAYLFGSRAHEKAGPLSDYDFAIYVGTKSKKKAYEIKLSLMDQLSRLLKSDKIDVVILNSAASPEMKYHIITSGKLLFERTPYKVMIEPRIYNEYFDFRIILSRYGLTRSRPT